MPEETWGENNNYREIRVEKIFFCGKFVQNCKENWLHWNSTLERKFFLLSVEIVWRKVSAAQSQVPIHSREPYRPHNPTGYYHGNWYFSHNSQVTGTHSSGRVPEKMVQDSVIEFLVLYVWKLMQTYSACGPGFFLCHSIFSTRSSCWSCCAVIQ